MGATESESCIEGDIDTGGIVRDINDDDPSTQVTWVLLIQRMSSFACLTHSFYSVGTVGINTVFSQEKPSTFVSQAWLLGIGCIFARSSSTGKANRRCRQPSEGAMSRYMLPLFLAV